MHSEIAHTLGRARRRAAPRRSTTTPCGRSGGGGSRGAGRGCACRRCARVEHLLSAAPQECRELIYVRVTDTHAVLPHSAEERATLLAALLLADEKDRLAQKVSPRRHTDAAKCASTSTERYVLVRDMPCASDVCSLRQMTHSYLLSRARALHGAQWSTCIYGGRRVTSRSLMSAHQLCRSATRRAPLRVIASSSSVPSSILSSTRVGLMLVLDHEPQRRLRRAEEGAELLLKRCSTCIKERF